MSSRKATTTKIPVKYIRRGRKITQDITGWVISTDLETGLPRLREESLGSDASVLMGEVDILDEPVYCIVDHVDRERKVVKRIGDFPGSRSSLYLDRPLGTRVRCIVSSSLREIESIKVESKVGGLYFVRVSMKGCKEDLMLPTRLFSDSDPYTISKSDENFIVPNTAHLPLRLSDIQEDL